MPAMMVAQTLLGLCLIYLACGLLFAVAFVTAGVGRVDAAARGTSLGFRLLILPGTGALWPLLLLRWVMLSRKRLEGTHP
jgi:hypothetical protein